MIRMIKMMIMILTREEILGNGDSYENQKTTFRVGAWLFGLVYNFDRMQKHKSSADSTADA
jgi:hypothetical protein